MKKTIFGALALLLTSNLFACHNWPQGSCGDSAYFKTADFYNGAILECRYQGGDGTIIYQRTMPDTGSTDKLYSVPYPIGGAKFGLEWHYYYQGAWTDWVTDSSVNTDLCKLLPISFTNFSAIKSGSDLKINFTNQDESIVNRYDILLSKDGQSFDNVKTIPANGSHSYSITLVAASLGFLLPLFFVGFKRKRLFYFLSVISLLLFFSCKKEIDSAKVSNYHYAKISAITSDGFTIQSNIIKF